MALSQNSFLARELRTIFSLAVTDFRRRHAGSYLGILWAFIQPVVTIFVFWFVFEMGLRTQTVEGVPFLIWLICGLVPWFYFSEALASASGSLIEYSYLVKKIVFRVELLPFVKVSSAAFIHLIFMILLFVLVGVFSIQPTVMMCQLIYYFIACTALISVCSLVAISIVPFLRDLTQVITIGLQFGMWLTPIMWNPSQLPERFHWVLYANPMYYIVDGYRDAILSRAWFWQKGLETSVFWSFVAVVGIVGRLLYRRLRPHFADVL